MTNIQYFGGIESGGTKFVCAIGKSEYEIIEEIRFPTGNPDETIDQAIDFFKRQLQKYTLSAIGIDFFGPLYLDPNSSTYG